MVRSLGNERVSRLKRTGGVDSLHRLRSPIPSVDWRFVLNVGPGEDNPPSLSPGFYLEEDAFLLWKEELGYRWLQSPGTIRERSLMFCEYHGKVLIRIQLQSRSSRTRLIFFSNKWPFPISILLFMECGQRGSTPRRGPTRSNHGNLRVLTLPRYPTSPSKGSSPPSEVL